MIKKLFRKKPTIYFVYGEKYKNSGSTIMRGSQLIDIVKARDKTRKYTLSRSNKNYRNSILFITKGGVQSINEKSLKKLKNNGNILLFDLVDSEVSDSKAIYADVIVAASKTAYETYIERFGKQKSYLLDHHSDPRAPDHAQDSLNIVKIGYFGEPINAVRSKRINEIVDIVHVDTSKQENSWFDKLTNYNVHYAVRTKEKSSGYKPFLKAFTAAKTGAVIISNDEQDDAIRWLGKEYPYIIHGETNEEKVLKMLDKVQKTFRKKEWYYAVERMKKIKELNSNDNISNSFIQLIEHSEKLLDKQ